MPKEKPGLTLTEGEMGKGVPLKTAAEVAATNAVLGKEITFEEFRQRVLALEAGDIRDAELIFNLPRVTRLLLDMWVEIAGEAVLREATVNLHPLTLPSALAVPKPIQVGH